MSAPQPVPPRRGERLATLEDVRAAYRLILGREPENEAVLSRHLAQVPTLSALRARFLNSEEFRGATPGGDKPVMLPLAPDALPVEVAADPARLQAMLERTGSYWAQVGQEAPHWSVLTNEIYLPDRIAETKGAFYATGAVDADLVRRTLRRHGLDPAHLPRCVEYGCGVGRATLALAAIFQRVVGCDISRPHLDLARAEAARRGLANVAWHHSSIAAPMPGGTWNFWYSRIVLQHNPPPVIAHLLRLAFAGLAPGGIALFQVPTHFQNYRFSIDAHLQDPRPPTMEMHALPQHHIFALAAEAGLEVLEVREDTHAVTAHTSTWLSNMFLLRRPAG